MSSPYPETWIREKTLGYLNDVNAWIADLAYSLFINRVSWCVSESGGNVGSILY